MLEIFGIVIFLVYKGIQLNQEMETYTNITDDHLHAMWEGNTEIRNHYQSLAIDRWEEVNLSLGCGDV